MSAYICSNCGNKNFIEGKINQVFNIDEKLVYVENIPALLCSRCQEPILTLETTEGIRLLLHSNKKPKKYISAEVFEFA